MIVPMTAETSTPANDALDNITYAAQYNDLRISARECLKTDLIARVILFNKRKVLWFREHATKSKKVNETWCKGKLVLPSCMLPDFFETIMKEKYSDFGNMRQGARRWTKHDAKKSPSCLHVCFWISWRLSWKRSTLISGTCDDKQESNRSYIRTALSASDFLSSEAILGWRGRTRSEIVLISRTSSKPGFAVGKGMIILKSFVDHCRSLDDG